MWERAFRAFLSTPDEEGRLRWKRAFLDGTFLAQVKVTRPVGRPRTRPKELVADRGYDSEALRRRLGARGIKPCIPRRRNAWPRRGRKPDLSGYRQRWVVERTSAWLGGPSATGGEVGAQGPYLSGLPASALHPHPLEGYFRMSSKNVLGEPVRVAKPSPMAERFAEWLREALEEAGLTKPETNPFRTCSYEPDLPAGRVSVKHVTIGVRTGVSRQDFEDWMKDAAKIRDFRFRENPRFRKDSGVGDQAFFDDRTLFALKGDIEIVVDVNTGELIPFPPLFPDPDEHQKYIEMSSPTATWW